MGFFSDLGNRARHFAQTSNPVQAVNRANSAIGTAYNSGWWTDWGRTAAIYTGLAAATIATGGAAGAVAGSAAIGVTAGIAAGSVAAQYAVADQGAQAAAREAGRVKGALARSMGRAANSAPKMIDPAAAAMRARQRLANAQGRQSTILTGPLGITDSGAIGGPKTLIGA